MRLLLDKHYSPKIAHELRERGHDVSSVTERDELRGLGDRDLWERASREGRALVTEDVADFTPLVREAAVEGARHFGIVFTSPHSLPRALRTIGVYVDQLDAFLRDRPNDDALAGQVHWLGAEPSD